MGASSSLIVKTNDKHIIKISDVYDFGRNTMPKKLGLFSGIIIQPTQSKVNFFMRCPGQKGKLIMCAIKKKNGNLRILYAGDNRIIGRLKKSRSNAYQLYAKKRRKNLIGQIAFTQITQKKIKTEISIVGHKTFKNQLFINPKPGRLRFLKSRRNTRFLLKRQMIFSLCKIRHDQFRLDCGHPFSWLNAFSFAAAAILR